jgi:hypothetical protein
MPSKKGSKRGARKSASKRGARKGGLKRSARKGTRKGPAPRPIKPRRPKPSKKKPQKKYSSTSRITRIEERPEYPHGRNSDREDIEL